MQTETIRAIIYLYAYYKIANKCNYGNGHAFISYYNVYVYRTFHIKTRGGES